MVTIDWNTQVITVPISLLTLISGSGGAGSLYELDVNDFRLALKDVEDSEGMSFPDTHRHNTEVTISGTTYARTFEVINGYTVTFEPLPLGEHYTVRCVGANHNIADVLNFNSVNLIIGNSAGLQTVATGGGGGEAPSAAEVAAAVWSYINRTLTSAAGLTADQAQQLAELHKIHGLLTGTPLVVSPTQRQAGSVTQSIGESGGVVTVTRQP
jgi:hypothetical protein